MSHLSTDRLAALGDTEPTPAEATHLAACAECAGERAAYRTLVAMAHAEREAFGLPLTRWDAIADALGSSAPSAPPVELAGDRPVRRVGSSGRLGLKIAAGFLLVVGGMMAGRASAGESMLPVRSASTQVDATAAPVADADVAVANAAEAAVFSSVEEARLAQQRSEALYEQAAAFLARHDSAGAGSDSPDAYRSRLAALDQMISSAREAMRQAPHDPVINGYYINTVGQREATLRQLNTVLPVSLRANSF